MLTDIDFYSKDEFMQIKDHNLDPEEQEEFWDTYLNPEIIENAHVQEGVYNFQVGHRAHWSHWDLVKQVAPSLNDFKAKGLDTRNILHCHYGWYGRAKSLDHFLEYLKPCIDLDNRFFTISVFRHKEDWEKSYKSGSFVEKYKDSDKDSLDRDAPFLSFQMEEFKYNPNKKIK